MTNTDITVTETIENRIFTIRGLKVMIDRDLARLYEVEIKRLNEAVKRNIKRFPDYFMFQLTKEEWQILRSQFATFRNDVRKYLPYAFTEHGVTMLASVLNSDRAIEISIKIIETFVALRQYAIAQSAKNAEIEELRHLLLLYIEKNDSRVNEIIIALNNLIETPKEIKKIGFRTE